eukprot:s2186_g5.t1
MVSISLLVAVSVMVFLGLLSGLNTRRCSDPKPLPFREGKPVRRAFRRNVKSEKIEAALRETGATLLSEETAYIYGCADLSVGFAYSHAVRLGELEREQYFYWRSMGDCGQLAEDLRFCLESGLPGIEHILAQWVAHLQEREDALQVYAKAERLAVFMQTIELVMLAEKLRSTSTLHEVMRSSFRVTLPEDLRELAESLLQKRVQKLDKGRISRAHLTLDVGFMLHHRIRNRLSPGMVRYLLWDSSPQFGRDYQMCLLQSVASADLPCVLQSFSRMHELFQNDESESFDLDENQTAALLEQSRQHMDALTSKLELHALPTVLIGFGSATFEHKLGAMMHAARLECFSSEDLRSWCKSLVSVASDYGVENRLNQVRSVPVEEMTHWFQDTSDRDVQLLLSGPFDNQPPAPPVLVDDQAFEDPDAAVQHVAVEVAADDEWDVPQPEQVSFEHLLSVPGLMHLIDNATKGLGDVMEHYSTNIFLCQQLCRLLRKRDTKPKVLQRNFSRGVGIQFAEDIRQFQGWVHPGRWGTVAFSVPELLKVRLALVTCWDEQLFLQGYQDDDEAQRHGAMDLAKDVTKAVEDPEFWGWISMLEVVCSLLRKPGRNPAPAITTC